MTEQFIKEFKENAIYRLDESSRMIKKAFEELEEKDIWLRSNEVSNSLGNIVLHLCGNITQYAIASLGNVRDERKRDEEFAIKSGFTKNELLMKLENTVERAKRTMVSCSSEELLREREVQGFNFSGVGVIIHVVEHYSYHTGQIAFWIKQLVNRDLGFYDGMDLNAKNEKEGGSTKG